MRTKTLVDGLKNSQKIRVIIDGFGIYTTVGNIFNVYAHHSLKQAAWDGLLRLSSDRYFAERANKGPVSPIYCDIKRKLMIQQADIIAKTVQGRF
jgi:hypothetical protein